jgi:hypothetical protein
VTAKVHKKSTPDHTKHDTTSKTYVSDRKPPTSKEKPNAKNNVAFCMENIKSEKIATNEMGEATSLRLSGTQSGSRI